MITPRSQSRSASEPMTKASPTQRWPGESLDQFETEPCSSSRGSYARRMNRWREQFVVVTAVVAVIAATTLATFFNEANDWFNRHSLVTNLLASLFFALMVYVIIERVDKRRQRERWPVKDALRSIVASSNTASETLESLILERAMAIRGTDAMSSDPVELDPEFALFAPDPRGVTASCHVIAEADPQWFDATFRPVAIKLSAQVAEQIVAAGAVLAQGEADPLLDWAKEDSENLERIARAAEFVSSAATPLPDLKPSIQWEQLRPWAEEFAASNSDPEFSKLLEITNELESKLAEPFPGSETRLSDAVDGFARLVLTRSGTMRRLADTARIEY